MEAWLFGAIVGAVTTLLLVLVISIVNDRGHAVLGVNNAAVQDHITDVIRRYTTLRVRHEINSGPTHQRVLSGGTVLAYFDKELNLPKNARSYVVWGKERRVQAAHALVKGLRGLGFEAQIVEPLPFPSGTFVMVVSDAFCDNAHAFRPHWIKMAYLETKRTKS